MDDDDFELWSFMTVIWPIVLLMVLTELLVKLPRKIGTLSQSRVKRRRARELEEAAHQTALAEERAKQARALDEEMRTLGLE